MSSSCVARHLTHKKIRMHHFCIRMCLFFKIRRIFEIRFFFDSPSPNPFVLRNDCICYASVFCQLAFSLDIVSFHVIICRSYCPRGSPHTSGFLIVNIQHVEYLRFAIGVPPTFIRADSVTLNTHHTTGKSDKIIFRPTKIIGTLPRIVGRGEIDPKSARLSCDVYPALVDQKRLGRPNLI